MPHESDFWNYLKPKLQEHGYFERIESPISSGVPDVLFQVEGTNGWVELKYKMQWEQGLGTTAIQRDWLKKWIERGGNAFLLARIGNIVLLVPGNRLNRSSDPDYWGTAAIYESVVGSRHEPFDANQVCRYLSMGV